MRNDNLEELIAQADENMIREYVLSHPESLKSKTSFNVSPIVLSCFYQKNRITELLFSLDEKIDFFEACAANKFDIVAHHIYQNHDIVNVFYDNGYTGLGLACYFGHEEIAKYLILKGANVNIPSDNEYRTFPLYSAVIGNFTSLTATLLKEGANANIQQAGGITPLHIAAKNGNIELIITLLENGASVEAKTEEGKTPSTMAQENGHLEIAEILS